MKLKIAVLPGDGIGPEITKQALEVTKAICKKFNHTLEHSFASVGACAIDETGNPYPQETHDLCMQADAVLPSSLRPCGRPKYIPPVNSRMHIKSAPSIISARSGDL